MKEPVSSERSLPRATIALMVVAALCMLLNQWLISQDDHSDFLGFYVGAKFAGTSRLYDHAAILKEQLALTGTSNPTIMSVRLPIYYSLISPLAKLPMPKALGLWHVFGCLAFTVFVLTYPTRHRLLLTLAVVASFPVWTSLATGQDATFLLMAFGLAILALSRGHDFTAGLLLAVMSIKFHLIVFVPVVLLVQRQWRMLGGLVLGASGLLASSFYVSGFSWPAAYLKMILAPDVSPRPNLMPSFRALAAAAHIPFLEYALAIPVLLLVIAIAKATDTGKALGAALLAGVLCAHHAYMIDCALPLPALLGLALEASTEARILGVFLLLPGIYVATILGAGAGLAVMLGLALVTIWFRLPRLTSPYTDRGRSIIPNRPSEG